MERVQGILLAESLDDEAVDPVEEAKKMGDDDSAEAVVIRDANFEWEEVQVPPLAVLKTKGKVGKKPSTEPISQHQPSTPFSLKGINLSIPRGGRIIAITGPIGSGKSSLILGE